MLQEMGQALLSLRRAPGFTALAVATLGIGIGANTSIFSMVDGVLLRRLPYGYGGRLVHISHASALSSDARFSIPEIRDLREQSRAFDAVVEYHSMAFQLYGHGDPQRVQTGVVSDNFFQVLGVKPLYGRLFRRGEEAVGAPPVVLLSYRYWVDVMGADPHAVGSTFVMNDKVHTVVGILPPLPTYPDANDIWMPAGACPFRSAPAAMASRTARLPTVFARLKPGTTLASARADVEAVDARLRVAYPEAYPPDQRLHSTLHMVGDEMTAESRPVVLLLFATALFLMLAAATNFASLTLTRQAHRARELAVREALGSGAWRLYRQLALESLLITGAGGLLGLLLASSGIGLLRTLATRLTPRAAEITINPAVIAYAVATCVLVGLAVAGVPFLRSGHHAGVADRLRQGNSGAMSTRAEGRLRRTFVIAQVSVAFVLLVGAGLITRSLVALQGMNAGFDPGTVVTARLPHNFTKYPTNADLRALGDRLLQRLETVRGARAVAIANTFPLNGQVSGTITFQIAGQAPAQQAAMPTSEYTAVSPGYFATVGIPLLRGRLFTSTDRDTLAPPIVVSRSLATKFWPGRSPLGTTLSFDNGDHWSEVVGVVGDVRQYGLDQGITDEIYVPAAAVPPADIRVLIRAAGPSAPIVAQLRDAVRSVDDHEAVASISTLEAIRGTRLLEPRVRTALLLSFALLALLLAAAGLAGVVGYTVSQRIPEIAIRLALGANTRRILWLVSRDGVGAAVAGSVIGAAIALVLGRFLKALLFHVRPDDPTSYALVAIALVVTALAACLVPARSALAADPSRVLRSS